MQRETKKPKVRLTRNDDGSIGAPKNTSDKTDDLVEAWSKQQSSSALSRVSFTKELEEFKGIVVKKLKLYQSKQNKKVYKSITLKFINPISVKNMWPHTKKHLILKGTLIILVVLTLISFIALSDENTNKDTNNGEVQGAIQTKVTPNFAVLTPLGDGVESLGGFAKISPEGAPSVYAFRDTIGGTPIKVSQQKLPDNLRSDQQTKLKDLAESFNAKEALEIGDNKAYIGTSVNGVQSVVYIKGENLVLIASENIIPNSEWVTYIGNLRY